MNPASRKSPRRLIGGRHTYFASGGAFSELYHANGANGYDNLNRLKEFRRGTLTGADTISDANTTYRQVFTLDVVSNWTEFKDDAGDGSTWNLDQDRTHNLVNEITDIAETTGPAWVTPAWCARGNMTSGPDVSDGTVKRHFIYDAWNRLVQVKADSGGSPGTLIAEYRFDALNRRIAKLIPNGQNWNRTDYYYNNAWQVLEERYAEDQANKDTPAANAKAQYVWSAKHIDSPVLRDRDAAGVLGRTGERTRAAARRTLPVKAASSARFFRFFCRLTQSIRV